MDPRHLGLRDQARLAAEAAEEREGEKEEVYLNAHGNQVAQQGFHGGRCSPILARWQMRERFRFFLPSRAL